MNGSWTNWKISPSPSEKNLPLGGQVFICPRGQGVGGAPNVHESPR